MRNVKEKSIVPVVHKISNSDKLDPPRNKRNLKSRSVLQEWVCQLSWKKQTVMIGAIRSPDSYYSEKTKRITKWIRKTVLENADTVTGFMSDEITLPHYDHVHREFERLPLHCAHHSIIALQVIGIEHPVSAVRATASKFYYDAVKAQHLNPETRDQYESRYEDRADEE